MCHGVRRAGPETDFALPRPAARSYFHATAGISLPRLTDAQSADTRADGPSVDRPSTREVVYL